MTVATAESPDVARPPTEPRAPAALVFDHVGLIVPSLAAGRDFLAAALEVVRWTPITEDAGLRVSVQFGASAADGVVYELVAPFGEHSPIANALRQGKHILNHLAYRTADLEQAGERLRAQGCYPAGAPEPALAYGGSRVQFFVSPLRFVIELIERPDHRHGFVAVEEEQRRNEP